MAIAWRMAALLRQEESSEAKCPRRQPAAAASLQRVQHGGSWSQHGCSAPGGSGGCARSGGQRAAPARTVHLRHVAAALDAHADVHRREARAAQQQDGLEHLIAKDLRLNQLQGHAVHLDDALPALAVGHRHRVLLRRGGALSAAATTLRGVARGAARPRRLGARLAPEGLHSLRRRRRAGMRCENSAACRRAACAPPSSLIKQAPQAANLLCALRGGLEIRWEKGMMY